MRNFIIDNKCNLHFIDKDSSPEEFIDKGYVIRTVLRDVKCERLKKEIYECFEYDTKEFDIDKKDSELELYDYFKEKYFI